MLSRLRAAAGEQVSSFELMPRLAVELTVKHVPGVANPLEFGTSWYVLIELASANPHQELNGLLTAQLEDAAAAGIVSDALLASSLGQAGAMWKLRESVPEAQRKHGASIKHDVSVPISAIPALIEQGTALAQDLAPEGEVVSYGHAGDGNLHFNVSQKPGADLASFAAADTPSGACDVRSGGEPRRQHQRRTWHRSAQGSGIRAPRGSGGTQLSCAS